ncbi:MAG: hypothetical protein ABIP44_08190 [Pseudoxanthomonas sp.]
MTKPATSLPGPTCAWVQRQQIKDTECYASVMDHQFCEYLQQALDKTLKGQG